VNKLLADFRLTLKADTPISKYSGGNKRKMSLALSTVGNPPVVLLDEPTTGMDTNTRRKVWEALSDLRERSGVVLTTHSMEEADALCNTISIMVNGQKCVSGTPLELKAEHGSGYRVTIRSPNIDGVKKLMSELWKNAVFVDSASSLTSSAFDITTRILPASEFAGFFRKVENVRADLSITEYSLTQATLDHVFINFNATQVDRNVGSQK